MPEIDTEPDLMDVLRPLLALQDHFPVSWGIHVGYRDQALDRDMDLPPTDEPLHLQVRVDIPREVAEQMHLASRMFEGA